MRNGGVEVQWWENGFLKYVRVKPRATVRGNLRIDFGGRILVFRTLAEPCDVIELQGGKWVKVGRVTKHREIILGPGESSSEIAEKRAPFPLAGEAW